MNDVLSRSIGRNKKISPITLGALEDMGYVVNYTAADPYGIDDIGDCSICPENIPVRRRRCRRTMDTSLSSCPEEGVTYQNAVAHGKAILHKVLERHDAAQTMLPDGVIYVGNHGRGIVTYMSDDGTLCTTTISAW